MFKRHVELMDAVEGLAKESCSAVPGEVASLRDTKAALYDAHPDAMADKFDSIVGKQLDEWQEALGSVRDLFKAWNTSRLKHDHYKEKVESLKTKITRGKADRKTHEALGRVGACPAVALCNGA